MCKTKYRRLGDGLSMFNVRRRRLVGSVSLTKKKRETKNKATRPLPYPSHANPYIVANPEHAKRQTIALKHYTQTQTRTQRSMN